MTQQSRLGMLLLVLAVLSCAACTSRAGPIVRDVRYAPDGKVVVERCDLVLTYVPFQYVPDPSFEGCHIGPPRGEASSAER